MLKEQWINVKDRLPDTTVDQHWIYTTKKSQLVLVFGGVEIRTAHLIESEYDGSYWQSACSEQWELKNITHWMELPEEPDIRVG